MRAARSVTDWSKRGAVVRLHIGLEAPEDLTADLARGFDAMNAPALKA
jgi:cystathionine beta-lyase